MRVGVTAGGMPFCAGVRVRAYIQAVQLSPLSKLQNAVSCTERDFFDFCVTSTASLHCPCSVLLLLSVINVASVDTAIGTSRELSQAALQVKLSSAPIPGHSNEREHRGQGMSTAHLATMIQYGLTRHTQQASTRCRGEGARPCSVGWHARNMAIRCLRPFSLATRLSLVVRLRAWGVGVAVQPVGILCR